jgi:hypothetical protein
MINLSGYTSTEVRTIVETVRYVTGKRVVRHHMTMLTSWDAKYIKIWSHDQQGCFGTKTTCMWNHRCNLIQLSQTQLALVLYPPPINYVTITKFPTPTLRCLLPLWPPTVPTARSGRPCPTCTSTLACDFAPCAAIAWRNQASSWRHHVYEAPWPWPF